MTESDNWRERYVRILTTDIEIGENPSEEEQLDLQALEDLVDAGFIRGKSVVDYQGELRAVSTRGVTLAGKVFAEEQIQILKDNSFWGRIKSGTGLFIGWLAGIISALVIQYLTNGG